jgi:hypothetical protein
MLLLLVMGLAFVGLSLTESSIASNARMLTQAFYAAEAGVESLYVDLRTVLIATPNPAPSALPAGANLAPSGARAPSNPNLTFDFSGTPAATRVGYVRTVAPYKWLTMIDKGTFAGLSAETTDYEITAQASGPLGTRARVSQVIQYMEIPLFQFGVFYGSGVDLEIAPGAPMTFNGRVHANSNIYAAAVSGINFDSYVTTAGNIYRYIKRDATPTRYNNPQVKDAGGTYHPLNFDHFSNVDFGDSWSESDWRSQAISTFGGTIMDHAMGVQEIPPPIPDMFNNPSNPDAVAHGMIERGVAGDSSAMQAAKLYYQAGMRIMNGVATNASGNPVSLPAGVVTTGSFYDKREGKTMTVTQVDIGALQASGLSPSNGIIYVSADGGDKAVRLVNGAQLPNGGLTVVTDNPMYIQGDYNTVNKQPAAVLADAVTILSNNWGPNHSDGKGDQNTDQRPATNTTVNAAFALGPSAESQPGQGNGQLENVIRFLENWSGVNFTYRGSIIALWHSLMATGPWRDTGNSGSSYYQAPNRNWGYDTLFDTTLPPGTPRAISIVRGRWSQS